jgi:hypothetical protein
MQGTERGRLAKRTLHLDAAWPIVRPRSGRAIPIPDFDPLGFPRQMILLDSSLD